MAHNQLLTPDMILDETLALFLNRSVMIMACDRRHDNEFAKKLGDTIRVRRNIKYKASEGAAIAGTITEIVEGSQDITLTRRNKVALEISSADFALDVRDFSQRYLTGPAIELAQIVESGIGDSYKKVYNQVGTFGQNPTTFNDIADVDTLLEENGVVQEHVSLHVSPRVSQALSNGLQNAFPTKIAVKAIEKALVTMYGNSMIYRTNSLSRHTNGELLGTPVIMGANQDVTYASVANSWQQSLVMDGFAAADVLTEGTVFTIDGVFAVNDRTRQSTGTLQNFVVRETTGVPSAGVHTAQISPPIIPVNSLDQGSEAYPTVDVAPADNAAITVVGGSDGDYLVNMAISKKSHVLTFATLGQPKGSGMYSQRSLDGVNMRLISDYNVLTDEEVYRFDILWDISVIEPGYACRLIGL